MSLVRHRECMFCHTDLVVTDDRPVNLAFMDHVGAKSDCQAGFDQWTVNMQTDFQGD